MDLFGLSPRASFLESLHGLPLTPLHVDWSTLPADTEEQIRNMMEELVALYRQREAAVEDANGKLQSSRVAQNDLEAKANSLRLKIEDLEREVWDVEQKRRKLEAESRVTIKSLKEQVAKLTKENAMLSSKDVQYKHEMRRKEKDFVKLQERLLAGFNSLNKEGKQGMEVLNAAKPAARPRWNVSSGSLSSGTSVEELNKLAYAGSEERISQLVAENSKLKDTLKQVYTDWNSAIDNASTQLKETVKHDLCSPNSKAALEQALQSTVATAPLSMFDLPFELNSDSMQSAFKKQVDQMMQKRAELSKQRERESNAVSLIEAEIAKDTPNRDVLSQLITRLHEYREMIEEQDIIIQSAVFAHQSTVLQESRRLSIDEAPVSCDISSKLDLQAQKRELEQLKSALEWERMALATQKNAFSVLNIPATPSGDTPARHRMSLSAPATPSLTEALLTTKKYRDNLKGIFQTVDNSCIKTERKLQFDEELGKENFETDIGRK